MKNKGMTIYLAGPISGLTYKEATDWRNEITPILSGEGFNISDPMQGKEFLDKEGAILDNVDQELNALTEHKNIYILDIFRIKKSDVLLINFLECKKVSIGTVSEISIAHEYDKLVILIMNKNNVHNHPFITQRSIVVKDMKNALLVLKNI